MFHGVTRYIETGGILYEGLYSPTVSGGVTYFRGDHMFQGGVIFFRGWDQIFLEGIIYFRGGSDIFWGDQIFLAGMMNFSGVRILPKGSHKSGGAINRNIRAPRPGNAPNYTRALNLNARSTGSPGKTLQRSQGRNHWQVYCRRSFLCL